MKEEFYYRDFRFRELLSPKYRHLLYLLFWPTFVLLFFGMRLFPMNYHEIHCALDDWIPFSKWFIFPYVSWFLFLAWGVLYSGVHDIAAFIRLHKYLILTGSVCALAFILYPSMESMRPALIPGNDLASLLVRFIYAADTPTNIMPSEHVIDAFGIAFTGFSFSRPTYRKKWFRAALIIQALTISASTVLVKQHSVLDVIAAVPLTALGWFLFFRKPEERQKDAC